MKTQTLIIGVIGITGAGKSTIIRGMIQHTGVEIKWQHWKNNPDITAYTHKKTRLAFIEIPSDAVGEQSKEELKSRYGLHRILCIDAPVMTCSRRKKTDLLDDLAHPRRHRFRSIADEMVVNTVVDIRLRWVIDKLIEYYQIMQELGKNYPSIF